MKIKQIAAMGIAAISALTYAPAVLAAPNDTEPVVFGGQKMTTVNANADIATKPENGLDRFQLVEEEQKETFQSSAFMIGNDTVLSGRYERDLFAMGSKVQITESAEVLGDVYVAGNIVEIDANITGNVYVFAQSLILDGAEFTGDIYVAGADSIEFRNDVNISGLLKYEEKTELIGAKNATIGNQETYEIAVNEDDLNAMHASGAVFSFIMNVALAIVILFIGKKAFEETKAKKVAKYNMTKALGDFGVGICVLVGMPIVALVTLVTVIGAKVALVLGLIYVVILLLAKIAAGWLMGELFKKMIKKDFSVYLSTILGLAVVALFSELPFVGWIINLLAFGIGTGMVTRMIFRRK